MLTHTKQALQWIAKTKAWRAVRRRAIGLWNFQLPRLIRAYLRTRFTKLIALWTAIFLSAPLVNLAVEVLSNDQFRNVIQSKGFAEFAELKLVIALCLGTVIVLVVHRLLKRTITIDEAEAGWGEDVVDGVMDEISAAATHFACVLLVAHFFSGLGFHWDSNFGAALFFMAIAVYTFDARTNAPDFAKPVPGEFGAELELPLEDAVVSQTVPEVAGVIYKRLPRGYSLWLVRRWEEDAEVFYPDRVVQLSESRRGAMTFSTPGYVGGQHGDSRFLELWLVGPQGEAVFDAWMNGNNRFVQLQGDDWDHRFYYPGLIKRTDDMTILFASRRVKIRLAEGAAATSQLKAVPASN